MDSIEKNCKGMNFALNQKMKTQQHNRLSIIQQHLLPTTIQQQQFHTTLLHEAVSSQNKYTVRPLHVDDYYKNYLPLLGQLTNVGTVTFEQFKQRLEELKDAYFVAVIEDKGKIVASATLLVEKKFLHSCGKCGHIEDVVVDAAYRGKKLGDLYACVLNSY